MQLSNEPILSKSTWYNINTLSACKDIKLCANFILYPLLLFYWKKTLFLGKHSMDLSIYLSTLYHLSIYLSKICLFLLIYLSIIIIYLFCKENNNYFKITVDGNVRVISCTELQFLNLIFKNFDLIQMYLLPFLKKKNIPSLVFLLWYYKWRRVHLSL